MKKTILSLCAAAALATGMVGTTVAPAAADPYYSGHRYHGGGWGGHRYRGDWGHRRYYRHHHGHGDAVAAGVVGLAAGALIGGALADRGPRYYDGYDGYPEGRVYYRPAPRYYIDPPVSSSHTARCEARYRTYDVRTDTFIGNDGRAHACRL
ncbi:BA14K family protein [Mangrovicella endophytica]|uniref:BA14K family protein n=1 Tax=Mangrovicella endophytica TaxID=2066697 RepID=UPI001FDF67F4|nr:BA14K family protein [Mangrovicella endophytica]